MSEHIPEEWEMACAHAINDAVNDAIDRGLRESRAISAHVVTHPSIKAALTALSALSAAPRQAEVASRQWQIATDIATRMVAGEPYTDNDVHQLAEAVAYLAAEERSDDGETPDQEKT